MTRTNPVTRLNVKEEWRLVEGSNNYYVSDQGRVKHCWKNSEHLLQPFLHSRGNKGHCTGYFVKITYGQHTYMRTVGKLIWEAFRGKTDRPVIHINGDISDHRLSNLLAVKDEVMLGKLFGGKAKGGNKKYLYDLNLNRSFKSAVEAAKFYGCGRNTIYDHINHKYPYDSKCAKKIDLEWRYYYNGQITDRRIDG